MIHKGSTYTDPIKYFIAHRWAGIKRRLKYHPEFYSHVELKITREEFSDWCHGQKDLILSLDKPSIDRIDSNKHYELENMQIIEFKKNCSKESVYSRNKKKRGIYWYPPLSKWGVKLMYDRKQHFLGYYSTKEEAYEKYYNEFINQKGEKPW